MEKKLTDEEIVKALECKVGGCMICESVNAGCPYDMGSYCDHETHLKDILDLIHRLQDDYSKLKERYVKVLDLNEKVIAEQKAEIERLTKQNNELCQENPNIVTIIEASEEKYGELYDEAKEILQEQAVKDTAKEIYDYIKSLEEHGLPTSCVGEWVKNRLKERYGVEVE